MVPDLKSECCASKNHAGSRFYWQFRKAATRKAALSYAGLSDPSQQSKNFNTASSAWLLINELYELTTYQTWFTNVMILVCKRVRAVRRKRDLFPGSHPTLPQSATWGTLKSLFDTAKDNEQFIIWERQDWNMVSLWWNYLFLDHSHFSFLYLLGFLKNYGIIKEWLIVGFQQYNIWRT